MTNKAKMDRKQKVKNSLVLGGLVGTAGLFIAKLIGLLYSIPLSYILGSEELMSYYGTAYRIYSYTLNVFTAGIPFAISTLVAKYTVLEDNKTLLLVKKMSIRLMQILGAAGMILLILLSGVIAPVIAPEGGSTEIMAWCIRILALALFFVPVLSAYRGFWQGRKEMGEYAFSQSFEQIFRVGFLLSVSYVMVYLLGFERKYALYAAVLSTSVAAVAGILQIAYFDFRNIGEIRTLAKNQKHKKTNRDALLKELLILAVPYLLTAMLGYADDIFNSLFLPTGLRMYGYSTADYQVILSGFNYVSSKLTSIPQILAPGFVAALIPHVTEAVTQKDRKRVSSIIIQCIGIVLFIGSFLSAVIAIYARDIFHILFYTTNIDLASGVVQWNAIEGFLGTICPVTSMLMIALGMKKKILLVQLISVIVKSIVMLPLMKLVGYPGAVIASILGNSFILFGNLYFMSRKYSLNFRMLIRNFIKIVFALIGAAAVSYGLRQIGIDGSTGAKSIAVIKLMINAILCTFVYFGIAEVLNISKDLFHKDILAVVKDRIHRGRNR